MAYPTGVRILLDNEDITYYLFGKATIDTTIDSHIFRDLDLTPYLKTPGNHVIEIFSSTEGRVEVRAEIF